MNPQEISVVRDAIIHHNQIAFTTFGDDGIAQRRVACPHILGTKEGEWHMLVWQVNDESEKGFTPGAQRWRCFDLADVTDVRTYEGVWHRGWTTGRRGQHCVDAIDTAVDSLHAAEVRNTFPARIR